MKPLTLLTIAERLDPAVRMSRALEFAIRGADVGPETTAALTEFAMQLHDCLETLNIELEAQLEAERGAKEAERESK